tara:strand:- start:916 stop:1143 length:228 start_codon:yes stop_codon:yes gene_type:complete
MKFEKIADMVKFWAWNCGPEECREMIREHKKHTLWDEDRVAAEMARQNYPLYQIVQVCLPSAYEVLPDEVFEPKR